MPAKPKAPQVGELVRHQPSGLPVRVERIIQGNSRDVYRVMFGDGQTGIAEWRELEFNLQEDEIRKFSHELPVIR